MSNPGLDWFDDIVNKCKDDSDFKAEEKWWKELPNLVKTALIVIIVATFCISVLGIMSYSENLSCAMTIVLCILTILIFLSLFVIHFDGKKSVQNMNNADEPQSGKDMLKAVQKLAHILSDAKLFVRDPETVKMLLGACNDYENGLVNCEKHKSKFTRIVLQILPTSVAATVVLTTSVYILSNNFNSWPIVRSISTVVCMVAVVWAALDELYSDSDDLLEIICNIRKCLRWIQKMQCQLDDVDKKKESNVAYVNRLISEDKRINGKTLSEGEDNQNESSNTSDEKMSKKQHDEEDGKEQ